MPLRKRKEQNLFKLRFTKKELENFRKALEKDTKDFKKILDNYLDKLKG